MCDIDKALVLRGAAHFATYAAEREPPRVDAFTAQLIEAALRNKLPKKERPEPTAQPEPRLDPGPRRGTSSIRECFDALERVRKRGERTTDLQTRVFYLLRNEPDREFRPMDMAKALRVVNGGGLFTSLEKLRRIGFAQQIKNPGGGKSTRYKLTPRGATAS